MKIVGTTVSTGTEVKTMFNKDVEMTGVIGLLKQGKISIHWKINNTSGITEQVSVTSLNKRIKSNNITIIN